MGCSDIHWGSLQMRRMDTHHTAVFENPLCDMNLPRGDYDLTKVKWLALAL